MGEERVFLVPMEFDRRAARRFMESALEEVEDIPPGSRVVFDFSQVRYVSSSGISAVLRLYRECRTNGSELLLLAPSREVRSVLELAGLDRLVKMLPESPGEKTP